MQKRTTANAILLNSNSIVIRVLCLVMTAVTIAVTNNTTTKTKPRNKISMG